MTAPCSQGDVLEPLEENPCHCSEKSLDAIRQLYGDPQREVL